MPQPIVTGEVYRQIIVDGTYYQVWCLLVAHNGKHVIAWLNDAYQHDEKSTVARTTSHLEGGVNAGIKELVRRHRGMNENHARAIHTFWPITQ